MRGRRSTDNLCSLSADIKAHQMMFMEPEPLWKQNPFLITSSIRCEFGQMNKVY